MFPKSKQIVFAHLTSFVSFNPFSRNSTMAEGNPNSLLNQTFKAFVRRRSKSYRFLPRAKMKKKNKEDSLNLKIHFNYFNNEGKRPGRVRSNLYKWF